MKLDIKRQCVAYSYQSLTRCASIASLPIFLNLLLRDSQARHQFSLVDFGRNSRMDQEFRQVL